MKIIPDMLLWPRRRPRHPRRAKTLDPDRFDPDRADNAHLGFASGIHYCFGASLARTEAQVALPELARRLVNPRLVADPPPYRPSPELGGPGHLLIDSDTVAPAMVKEAGQVRR
jgi:cytochrome P450